MTIDDWPEKSGPPIRPEPAAAPSDELLSLVRSLRDEVAHLARRVAALEAVRAPDGPDRPADEAARTNGAAPAGPPEPAEPEAGPAEPEELSEETVLVISAAIAAFLGKKPYIRQIRLVASPTWTHQGRVTIQAGHALARTGASL